MKNFIEKLKIMGKTISVAESCTGGLIAKMITDVPGASSVFGCGAITYSNESKMKLLGVKSETLEEFGAVSEQTAREMAAGMRKVSGSDIAVSVTGIAGPQGGTEKKPVGTVCIGIATEERVFAKTFLFDGKRGQIRKLSARMALRMVYHELGIQIPKKRIRIISLRTLKRKKK